MTRDFTIVGRCRGCGRSMAGSSDGARALQLAAHHSHRLCTGCFRLASTHPAARVLFRRFYRQDTHWMHQAACRAPGADPDWFHPHDWDTDTEARAKAVCAECPVREPCLADAEHTRDAWGIRAGLTAEERRARHRQEVAR